MTDLTKLSEYDFIVVIDKSGSMGEPNKPGSSVTRWEAVQESAMTFVRDIEKFDSDGLGLVLFSGSGVSSHDGVTSEKIREVFAQNSPRGSTPGRSTYRRPGAGRQVRQEGLHRCLHRWRAG